MLKAKFQKKWVYGDPLKAGLENDDWMRWIGFVNIIADDHLPNTQIITAWDENGELYGYSQALLDESGLPAPGEACSIDVTSVQEDVEKASAEDFRVNTHKELLPIAIRVIKWIERREEKTRSILETIQQVAGEY